MKFSEMPYRRIDAEMFEEELKGLTAVLQKAGSGEEQLRIHERFYKLTDHEMTMATIAAIRHDINMTDPYYEEEQNYYDEKGPVFQNLVVAYQRALYESPYRNVLTQKIGPVAFRNIELAMRSTNELLVPLRQKENALITRYSKLLATAEIDWNGEKLNLSLMNPYLTSGNRTVRKAAWEKYTAFFTANEAELDEIYDQMVKNRTEQAKLLGYDNYLPLGYDRMNRNCYDRTMVASFRRQVKRDWVPLAEELHKRRAARLGLDRLAYYDEKVYFPEGNPAPDGTPQQILAAGGKMYAELSPETAEFFRFMQENELFDVLGRKTKRTGGYMTYLPDYKAPFIFANFNGTSGDLDVITHECGHAFQGWLASEDPVREHADITMETAEIHSMSMEFFTEPWMQLFFGERAADYVNMHLEDAICFIPYGTMVDEFQDIIYSNPGMTPEERRRTWNELEREYRPHMDYSGNAYLEQGGFWQKQHHIYTLPLYYIDYCLAQSCALMYKIRMMQDRDAAWKSYLKLCRLSASDFYTGLLKQVGLDNPFEDGCLAGLADAYRKLLSI